MIAGWQQWADAGCISSGLPKHIIEATGARKIGELNVGGCYLFQVPGTHHFLRPEVKLNDGYRESLTKHANELYYAELQGKGLIIFAGDEPHLDADRYAEAFFAAVKRLGVKRVVCARRRLRPGAVRQGARRARGLQPAAPAREAGKLRGQVLELRGRRDDRHVPARSGRARGNRVRLTVRLRARVRLLDAAPEVDGVAGGGRLQGLGRDHAPAQHHVRGLDRPVRPGAPRRGADATTCARRWTSWTARCPS